MTPKLKLSKRKFIPLPVLLITLFAVVGAYIVLHSKAQSSNLPGEVQCMNYVGCKRSSDFMREVVTQTSFNTARIDIYADLSIPDLVNKHPLMAELHHQVLWYGQDRDDLFHDEIKYCIDLESKSGQSNALIDSYTVTTPGDAKNITGSAFNLYFFSVPTAPNCSYYEKFGGDRQPALNYFGLAHGIQMIKGYDSTGGSGGGSGGDGTGTGTNGRGSGTRGTGGPGGGARSNSSATQQSNQSNQIPSASSQGDASQTTIEPSPFVDGGKTYLPGSDPDTLGSSTSSIAKKLFSGWYLIPTLLILVGGAGAAYWWFYYRKKSFSWRR